MDIDINFNYLQSALTRIDLLLLKAIERWQQGGQKLTDPFRGLYISDGMADALMARPIATNWGDKFGDANETITKEVQTPTSLDFPAEFTEMFEPRLKQLSKVFGLDSFEVDILLICLAPHLDLRYEKIFGYLQDDITKRQPSINLVLDLLCPSGIKRWEYQAKFSSQSPLFKYRLLERISHNKNEYEPLLSQALALDPTITAWVLGGYQPVSYPSLRLNLVDSTITTEDLILSKNFILPLDSFIEVKPLLVFAGADHLGQKSVAKLLGNQTQKPLLIAEYFPGDEEAISATLALKITLRDACLTGALPYLIGWDQFLERYPEIIRQLFDFPDTAIFAKSTLRFPKRIEQDRPIWNFNFPIPEFRQRQELWKHYLSLVEIEFPLDAIPLAGQFTLTSEQIRNAVRDARDKAFQRGDVIHQIDLYQAAQSQATPNLAGLASKITPRHTWEDLILPEDQQILMREMILAIRNRSQVLDDWGLGKKLLYSRGISALFAGPPGTGKTLAAEIVAGELNLDLFKIDLSAVTSKYIGETEKNLERIFTEAGVSNTILFFDEADALFGKRSEVRDAHDRYANLETSYLLQRIERYDGIVILATNMRSNLDEAFVRRLQFIVNFPFPGGQDRLRIWKTLFPTELPSENLNFRSIAQQFELSGANIRNVIVSAAFLASSEGERVTMPQLLSGIKRELKKIGRLIEE